MERFIDLVVHHWHNLHQAQCYPSHFAYVHYLWYYEPSDGSLRTKQWYDYEGRDKPYRQRSHSISDMDDGTILLKTYDQGLELANTLFFPTAEGYVGKTEPNYIDPKGRKVETTVTVTKDSFETSDKGWDENGNLLWGSERGPFKFTRCTR